MWTQVENIWTQVKNMCPHIKNTAGACLLRLSEHGRRVSATFFDFHFIDIHARTGLAEIEKNREHFTPQERRTISEQNLARRFFVS